MPEPAKLTKAKLEELTVDFAKVRDPSRTVVVQFNPETLKVSFANQLQQPKEERKGAHAQFVGSGSTKLALQLWFDVTAPQAGPPEADVRKLTQKVAYFITPQPEPGAKGVLVVPALRFSWGTFQFDGIVDSLEESLEYFSPEGRPLRASMSISVIQQTIGTYAFGEAGPGGTRPGGVGTRPLTVAAAGATIQGMAAGAAAGDWKAVAAANGIVNPRVVAPGRLLDLGGPT